MDLLLGCTVSRPKTFKKIPRVQLPSQPSFHVIAALNVAVKHRVPDSAAAINRLGDARRTKDGSQRGGIQQHPAAAAGILTEKF